MYVDPYIFKAILWLLGTLVSVLGVIGWLGITALFKMSKTLNKIETLLAVHAEKHTQQEKINEHFDGRLLALEKK